MEVDPGSVAGTAVDRFLEEPLARGLNRETAEDRFLDEPSDRGPAGETAVDRSHETAEKEKKKRQESKQKKQKEAGGDNSEIERPVGRQ